jgi:hypothetical protein
MISTDEGIAIRQRDVQQPKPPISFTSQSDAKMTSVSDEQEQEPPREMISTDEGIAIRRIDLRNEIVFIWPLEWLSVTCDCDPEQEPPQRDRSLRISEREWIELPVGIKNDRFKYRPPTSSLFKIDPTEFHDKSLSENGFANDSKQSVIGDVP